MWASNDRDFCSEGVWWAKARVCMHIFAYTRTKHHCQGCGKKSVTIFRFCRAQKRGAALGGGSKRDCVIFPLGKNNRACFQNAKTVRIWRFKFFSSIVLINHNYDLRRPALPVRGEITKLRNFFSRERYLHFFFWSCNSLTETGRNTPSFLPSLMPYSSAFSFIQDYQP